MGLRIQSSYSVPLQPLHMTLTDIPVLFVPSGLVSMGLGVCVAPLACLGLTLLVAWRSVMRPPQPYTAGVFVPCGLGAILFCACGSTPCRC
jgi:hypothetical protein